MLSASSDRDPKTLTNTCLHILATGTKANPGSFCPYEIIVRMAGQQEEEGEEEGRRYPRKELIFSSLPYAHALTLQVNVL